MVFGLGKQQVCFLRYHPYRRQRFGSRKAVCSSSRLYGTTTITWFYGKSSESRSTNFCIAALNSDGTKAQMCPLLSRIAPTSDDEGLLNKIRCPSGYEYLLAPLYSPSETKCLTPARPMGNSETDKQLHYLIQVSYRSGAFCGWKRQEILEEQQLRLFWERHPFGTMENLKSRVLISTSSDLNSADAHVQQNDYILLNYLATTKRTSTLIFSRTVAQAKSTSSS
jgi:hypothetical protein